MTLELTGRVFFISADVVLVSHFRFGLEFNSRLVLAQNLVKFQESDNFCQAFLGSHRLAEKLVEDDPIRLEIRFMSIEGYSSCFLSTSAT